MEPGDAGGLAKTAAKSRTCHPRGGVPLQCGATELEVAISESAVADTYGHLLELGAKCEGSCYESLC